MNQGAAPEDLYKGFTKHVHTSECYKVEKELTCTIPGIHVHTSDCYDEDGNLTCGQLQLSVHVHDDDCYTFEEKQTVVTATAGDYIITASYGKSAKIPDEAEFRAEIIEPETDEYSSNEDTMKETAGEDAEAQVMFNIGFYVDGEEIQPQGPVDIKFTLKTEDYSTGEDITILHVKDDGNVDVNQTVIDEENNASITTDSFSIYILLNNGTYKDFKPGTYGSYTADWNTVSDAFRNSSSFDNYKINVNELGLAANFHIVAFNSFTTASHVNGNVCCKYGYINNNIGTNNLKNELSYIQYLKVANSSIGTSQEGCALVLGSYNEVKIAGNNDGDEIDVKANGSNFFVKLDNPKKIIVDKDTDSAPFINMTKLETEIKKVRDDFVKEKQANATSYFTAAEDFGSYINLTNPDVAGYINVSVADLHKIKDHNLKMTGFTKGKKGSLIVNVNCEGCKQVYLPKSADIYVDGTAQGTGEVTTFENGKIIWNFYNCSGVEIHTYKMTGIIIAPEAYVIAEGNLNGQIIARDVKCTGETHRVGFTGTTLPVQAEFVFGKTVGGAIPSSNEVFEFELYEYDGSPWKLLQTKSNSGTTIAFDNITYDKESDRGEHWYKVVEKPGNSSQYVYDKTEFLMKVVVDKDASGNYKITSKDYYELPNGDSDITFSNGIVINKPTVSQDKLVFDNMPKKTEVSVEKLWKDADGNDLAAAKLPKDGIKVNLYRTTNPEIDIDSIDFSNLKAEDGVEKVNTESVVLNKENGWSYSWSDLKKETNDQKPYYYFVKEEPIEGYTVTYSNNSWFVEGTQTITNTEVPETTSLEVEKKFFAYDVNGVKQEIKDLKKANINNNDYITVRLIQVSTNKIVNGKPEEATYIGNALIDGTLTSLNANSEITVSAAKDWKCKIEELPTVGIDEETGDLIKYEYKIEEVKCSLAEYGADIDENNSNIEVKDVVVNGKVDHKLYIVRNLMKPTEIEIDKNWLTYTGTPDSLQEKYDSNITIDITLKQIAGDTVAKEWSYRLSVQGITNSNGESTYYDLQNNQLVANIKNVTLVEDKASKTGYKCWSALFSGLDAYYVVVDGNNSYLEKYQYEIEEGKLYDGNEELTSYTQDEEASVLVSNIGEDGKLTKAVIVNKSNVTFELPETGSGATIPIYIAGALTMLASGALLIYRRKLRNN